MDAKKSVSYTRQEKALLTSLIEKHKLVIESRKADGTALKEKAATWDKIGELFNSESYVTKRDVKQLKRCWDNMKQKARKSRSEFKFVMLKPDNGPESIIPHLNYTIDGHWEGSDNNEDSSEHEHIYIPQIIQPDELEQNESNTSSNKKINFSKNKKLVDKEVALRIKMLKNSIEQQNELHAIKMKVARAELEAALADAEHKKLILSKLKNSINVNDRENKIS